MPDDRPAAPEPSDVPVIETASLRLREWTERDLDAYVALCADPKVTSTSVMRKLGMTLERSTIHPQHRVPVVVYELTRNAG